MTPFPADLAADGVDEVLDVMYGGCPPWGEFSPLPHYVRLDLTDTGDQVWVQLGRFHGTDPDGHRPTTRTTSTWSPTPASSPTPSSPARPRRSMRASGGVADGAETHLAGSLEIVDRFRAIIHQPIT